MTPVAGICSCQLVGADRHLLGRLHGVWRNLQARKWALVQDMRLVTSQSYGLQRQYLVIFEELVVDTDGFCAAAHAVVQLCLKVQPGYRSILWVLLYCCKGLLKLLKTEQAVRLQERYKYICPASFMQAVCGAAYAGACRYLAHVGLCIMMGAWHIVVVHTFSKDNSLKSAACPSMCSTASSKRESSMSMTALQATASFVPGLNFKTAATNVIFISYRAEEYTAKSHCMLQRKLPKV